MAVHILMLASWCLYQLCYTTLWQVDILVVWTSEERGWYGECSDKLSSRVTPWLYFSWTLSSSVSHVSPSHLWSHLHTCGYISNIHQLPCCSFSWCRHCSLRLKGTKDPRFFTHLLTFLYFLIWELLCSQTQKMWLIHFKKVCWWARIQLICVLYVVGYVLLTVVHTLVKYPGSDSRLSCMVNCRTFPDCRKISTLMETHWFTYRKQSIFIFSIIIP